MKPMSNSMDSSELAADPNLAKMAEMVTQTNVYDVEKDAIAARKEMHHKSAQLTLARLRLHRDVIIEEVNGHVKVRLSQFRHETGRLLMKCVALAGTVLGGIYLTF